MKGTIKKSYVSLIVHFCLGKYSFWLDIFLIHLVYICLCLYIYIYIYIYTHTHVYMCVCVCVCVYQK